MENKMLHLQIFYIDSHKFMIIIEVIFAERIAHDYIFTLAVYMLYIYNVYGVPNVYSCINTKYEYTYKSYDFLI